MAAVSVPSASTSPASAPPLVRNGLTGKKSRAMTLLVGPLDRCRLAPRLCRPDGDDLDPHGRNPDLDRVQRSVTARAVDLGDEHVGTGPARDRAWRRGPRRAR